MFLLGIARMPDLGIGFAPFARLYLFAFLPYLVGVYVSLRLAGSAERWAIRIVLAFAVAFRLLLLFAPPTLSDDLYRYLWDGRVAIAGHNPYAHAPAASELAPLRDAAFARINHPEIPSIYPPFLQVQFAALALVSPGVLLAKALFTAWDLAVIALLVALLKRRGLPAAQVSIYAWSPLTIVEIAGNGHSEPAWVALVLAAILLAGRRVASGIALSLAALTKLVPFALVPLFFRSLRWKGLVAFGAVAALVSIPYASAGASLAAGIGEYADRWRANDSLFRVVLPAAEWIRDTLLKFSRTASVLYDHPRLLSALSIAKAICALILLGIVVSLVRRRTEPLRASLVTYGALLALSPIVHPWYVVPLVAFLAVEPNLPGLLLSALVVLAYHTLPAWRLSSVWAEDSFYVALEWVPVYALLVATIGSRLWAGLRGRGLTPPGATAGG